jgi:hypothetical protein
MEKTKGTAAMFPGAYQVTLLLDGEWLAQRRIRVAKKET